MSKASNYEQGRLNRITDAGAKNDSLDASAFKESVDPRAELVREKKSLEADISDIKARIAHAKHLAWERGSYTNAKTFKTWNDLLRAKSRRVSEIDGSMSSIRAERRAVADTKPNWEGGIKGQFDKLFHECAKEMLADAVYDRVRIAALHRLSSQS